MISIAINSVVDSTWLNVASTVLDALFYLFGNLVNYSIIAVKCLALWSMFIGFSFACSTQTMSFTGWGRVIAL